MARVRLRDARTADGERALYSGTYPEGYRHDVWPDHVERVAASMGMIRRYASRFGTAADLSCGDGAILRGLSWLREIWIGDLNKTPLDWSGGALVHRLDPGPLPESLDRLLEPVDLYVLSETIEHMDDPDGLLRRLTDVSRYLFLSTPLDEKPETGNVEHYWSWGQADMHQMLQDAGWSPLEVETLVPESTRHMDNPYHYQLWMAVHR